MLADYPLMRAEVTALRELAEYAGHRAFCRSLRCFAVVRASDGLQCGERLGWAHTSSHPEEPGECDSDCGLAAAQAKVAAAAGGGTNV